MFSKNSKEKKFKGIMENVRIEIKEMSKCIDFLKNWGNLTKRKNKKLRATDYLAIKNNLLMMPLILITSLSIINDNPRLKAKYMKLKIEIEKEIERLVKETTKIQEDKDGHTA